MPPLSPDAMSGLTFAPLLPGRYPAFDLALAAGRAGGTAPCVAQRRRRGRGGGVPRRRAVARRRARRARRRARPARGDRDRVARPARARSMRGRARPRTPRWCAAPPPARACRDGAAMTLSWRRPPSPARLKRSIDRFRGTRALVWGDFVLDEYWRCRTARVSREAPVLRARVSGAHRPGRRRRARCADAGGARRARRGRGWAGDDAAGAELRDLLEGAGIDARGLLTHPRAATVVKTRIVAGDSHTARQQVVRWTAGTRSRWRRRAARAPRPSTRHRIARRARDRPLRLRLRRGDAGAGAGARCVRGVPTAPSSAWMRATGSPATAASTLATPNEGEAAAAAGLGIAGERDLAAAARSLRKRMDASRTSS